MDMLAGSLAFVTGYIVPFLIVLTLIVFVHEMGHYLAGRWSGIGVTAFSIGFGPELIGFTDRHGTRWKLSAIPLGGYVKFLGDEDPASIPDYDSVAALPEAERKRTFLGAALWKRAITVAAGPIANFILAIAIFAVMFSIYGRQIADPIVAEVRPGSAAEAAGVRPGDLLVALDGNPVTTFDDVRRYVSVRPELKIIVTAPALPMTPERTEITDQFGNKLELGLIGIVTNQETGNFRVVEYGPLEAVGQGVLQSWHIVTGTFDYLSNLVSGRMKADQLGGPIRGAGRSALRRHLARWRRWVLPPCFSLPPFCLFPLDF